MYTTENKFCNKDEDKPSYFVKEEISDNGFLLRTGNGLETLSLGAWFGESL